MRLADVDQMTFARYGFHLYDWDCNRGQPGQILLGKHDFNFTNYTPQEAAESQIQLESGNFKDLTGAQMAEKFHAIFQRYQQFQNVSIHFRCAGSGADTEIPDEPFLFVLGNRV